MAEEGRVEGDYKIQLKWLWFMVRGSCLMAPVPRSSFGREPRAMRCEVRAIIIDYSHET